MKKCIYLLLGLLISVSLSALDETKTIGDTEFSIIQDACAGGDDLINHYYLQCLTNANLLREDWEPPADDMGLRTDYGTSFYANKAFVGAVGELQDTLVVEARLFESYRFLLDPTFPAYLSIANEVIPYLSQLNAPNPTIWGLPLDMAYILKNLAVMVDMLWWYDGGIYQDALASKLDSLTSWVYTRMVNTRPLGWEPNGPNGEIYPTLLAQNKRLTTAGGLGYAGVILENPTYIQFVDEDLCTFSWQGGGAWDGQDSCWTDAYIDDGYLNFNLQNSGIYSEGFHYQAESFHGLSLYFTARKRLGNSLPGIEYRNYYDDDIIQKMCEESIYLISPDFSNTCFDDSYKVVFSGVNFDPTLLAEYTTYPPILVEYYYQHEISNTELENNIRWYVNEYTINLEHYPYFHLNKVPYILSYSSSDLFSSNNIPTKIQESNYSNEEFTILRSTINTVEEFQEKPALWINHKKSRSLYHEHSDQASFIMYYKGRNLIIDPGYTSGDWTGYGRTWLNSPHSHNLIIISQDIDNIFSNEDDHLNTDYYNPDLTTVPLKVIEPKGKSSIQKEEITGSQSFKEYLINNGAITCLNVSLDYYDTDHNNPQWEPHGETEIALNRHFYFIDDFTLKTQVLSERYISYTSSFNKT
jgi:hypothetical protein